MARIRIPINPKMTGATGAYTYYVRSGEQIARQRQNSSNYGEGASRSVAQQTQRAKWANLVNFWKVAGPYLRSAFQKKASNQSDYNKFMSLNVPTSPIYLVKTMAERGAVLPYGYQVSEGEFPTLTAGLEESTNPNSGIITNLVWPDASQQPTTWGDFCSTLIANNPEWQNGDNFAVLALAKYTSQQGMPRLAVVYVEDTIDSASTTALASSPIGALLLFTEGDENPDRVEVRSPVEINRRAGHCAIHTRRSGQLVVSSETLMVAPSLYEAYTTEEAVQAAIESYGLSDLVELDPN